MKLKKQEKVEEVLSIFFELFDSSNKDQVVYSILGCMSSESFKVESYVWT